ncbi:MAG: valine--tRNA ligase [Alphaproteobacteria bacterium]|nr:valine--tRNA ligase [Alphaproteobacteria bacterium]
MLDKTFDPKSIEQKLYESWEKDGVFACDPERNSTPFTIMMPPPNVTGSLHMGHALNTTLQDVLIRHARMNGRDALWQPGTDHAGIATQMVVERKLEAEGLNRRDMGREKFLERIWAWKEESGGTIVRQMRALGATPDWARERFTMDEGLSKAVLKVFVRLYKEGLIYKDKRLVNWDPKLLTAISDLEVEHKEIKGKFYHVRYPIEDGSGDISIATTRPETILGDGAVAVHPDDERYKHLIGKKCRLPIMDRLIPIVADEYVKADFGSGAVKITAAHDFNDFEVYKRHKDEGVLLINILTPDARMNENCPAEYQGLSREAARKKVVEDFEALGLLDKIEDHVHLVPYGDRGGVVIEPYLTDQWYVDTPTLAKPAIEAVRAGRTTFHPKQYENIYFDWLENQLPWCISRQLWWGHRIPAWYDEAGHVYVAETEEEAQAEAGAGVTLTRDEDVLDTWFSSALWPFSTLGWPEETPDVQKMLERYYPGDVLVTGFDIITFWVSRMMMMGLHFMGDVPFKDVYIHALVRDSKGQKMSKSKGNVIDPLELTDKFGADALRFTLAAMATQGRDIRLSEDRVAGYRNFATKLWNAARYCEMNNCAPRPGFNPAAVEAVPNKWIIGAVIEAREAIDTAIAEYRFNEAAGAIYQFTWGTFCDWYLEFTKPILQEESHALAEETRAATGWVLEQILIMLNPFMPFITEELYAQLAERKKDDRLVTYDYASYGSDLAAPEAAEEMDWLIRLISEIRSVRANMNVPAGAKIDLLVKDTDVGTQERLARYDEIIKRMARLESIAQAGSAVPAGSLQAILDEATLIMPVADIIDLDAERTRLEKQITKLEDDIRAIEKKLGNKAFVDNAPADIVEEQKSRRAEAEATREKLAQALKQLAAA